MGRVTKKEWAKGGREEEEKSRMDMGRKMGRKCDRRGKRKVKKGDKEKSEKGGEGGGGGRVVSARPLKRV